MSKRKKLLDRIPYSIRVALQRYRKGNFHIPPDVSCLSELDGARVLHDAKTARLSRLWNILMSGGGVLTAVHWPEYDELVARMRARDVRTASKMDPMTAIEREYLAGNMVSFGVYDLCHDTRERAFLIANRRVKLIRSSLERGELSHFAHPDVQNTLLPLLHSRQRARVDQAITRLHCIPSFDAEGKTRRDQRLRAKQARCMTSLRQTWREIFAHPATLEMFQSRLEGQIWNNRRFCSRIA